MILTESDLRLLSLLDDGKIPEASACLTWSMVGIVDTDVIAQYEDSVGFDLSDRKPDAGPLDVSILPAAAMIGLRLAETADGAAWHCKRCSPFFEPEKRHSTCGKRWCEHGTEHRGKTQGGVIYPPVAGCPS